MLERLDRTLSILFKIELTISVGTLAAIILMNCGNLLSRWILRHPFDWILEISLILFVYSVMFIVPVLYKEKGFIQMHLVEERLGRKGASDPGHLRGVCGAGLPPLPPSPRPQAELRADSHPVQRARHPAHLRHHPGGLRRRPLPSHLLLQPGSPRPGPSQPA